MDGNLKRFDFFVLETNLRAIFEDETLKKTLEEVWASEKVNEWIDSVAYHLMNGTNGQIVNQEQISHIIYGGLIQLSVKRAMLSQIEHQGTKTLVEELVQLLNTQGQEIVDKTMDNFTATVPTLRQQLSTMKIVFGEHFDDLFV